MPGGEVARHAHEGLASPQARGARRDDRCARVRA